MFRTDLGDDESDEGDFEWDHGRVDGNSDKGKDDEVLVTISESGTIAVKYD